MKNKTKTTLLFLAVVFLFPLILAFWAKTEGKDTCFWTLISITYMIPFVSLLIWNGNVSDY